MASLLITTNKQNKSMTKLIIMCYIIIIYYVKKSDVTPFVIIYIFLSNCNLITHFLSN